MRRLFSSSSRARTRQQVASTHLAPPRLLGLKQYQRSITDIRPRQAPALQAWFTSSTPILYPETSGDHAPPNERKVKLGKSMLSTCTEAWEMRILTEIAIRILQERLPTLLASPLPQDILSPQITLHLFPSTHPHLPTVSGKLAYTAALWTSPVAWGRVPVVGNVKLNILSERMVKNGGSCAPADSGHEKLIVKWETCGKSEKKEQGQVSEAVEKITSIVGGKRKPDEEFSGLFLFEFDEEGRIVKHTIEHVEENGQWDKTTKVISVTDWLLGRAWGRREEGAPSLAFAKSTRTKEMQRGKDG